MKHHEEVGPKRRAVKLATNRPSTRWDAFTAMELQALDEFFRSFGPMRDYSTDIQKAWDRNQCRDAAPAHPAIWFR